MTMLMEPDRTVPFAQELQSIRAKSGWLLALGIALIVLGILALGSEFTAYAVAWIFGILLIASGGVEVAAAFSARLWSGFFVHLLFGILYFVVGVLMINHPGAGVDALALMLAASFLVGGLLRIVVALTHRFSSWGWVLLNGIVTFLLGVMIWQRWPEASEWVIGLIVGIELIFAGWSWVALALAARRLPKQTA
jgi:uncharacterized membrane protein HdeD (DUF308 family)